MKRIFPFILLLVPAWPALADPPAATVIVLPDLQQPAPAPAAVAVTKLTGTQLFVVQATSPVCVLGGVDGLLNIKPLKTPVTVFGNFVNPLPGDDDGRTYTFGYVYVVRAGGVGQVDLLVVGGDKLLVRRTLAVDNGQPLPPVPPGPVPPGPIPPGPVPPAPDAVLFQTLTDAFAKDKDSDKAASVAKLASVFRNAAKLTATDATFKTVKDMDEAVRFASQGAIGVLTIPSTRDAIGLWLRSQLPTKADSVLDDALRQKYVAAWTTLAATLEKVK